MNLPLLILIAALSALGLPATNDIGGGVPTVSVTPAAASSPAPASTDDIGGGVPTHH